jgi:hypothetical protein
MSIVTIKLEELVTEAEIGDALDNLKWKLKAMGQAQRVMAAGLYDMNVIVTELDETQTSFYSEERTEEQLMEVAATVYEEWLIWTYGATEMSYLLKMDVKPLSVSRTTEFKELLNFEKAPFILAAKRILEVIGRMK